MYLAKIRKEEHKLEVTYLNSAYGIEQIKQFHEQERGQQFNLRNNVHFLFTKQEVILMAEDEHYVHLMAMVISEYKIQGGN